MGRNPLKIQATRSIALAWAHLFPERTVFRWLAHRRNKVWWVPKIWDGAWSFSDRGTTKVNLKWLLSSYILIRNVVQGRIYRCVLGHSDYKYRTLCLTWRGRRGRLPWSP